MVREVFHFATLRLRMRCRDVQEPEQEPESSKFFRSRIGLGVKFNVKTGEELEPE